MFLANAFSLNMIGVGAFPCSAQFEEISVSEASRLAREATSAVGHADTAMVFSNTIGVAVAVNRATVALNKGDVVLVGQYRGPRLPEGATTLPEGATIGWYLVTIE